ncbi:MAG TPA: T9SS type A sorting domain-containing protein, partial [Bacteroidales bacterium]|nr:T9SS type A sorting domain-containing protein [Bacteroidales bacterium]
TPKSWLVETDKWFRSYRLKITEINGDSQGLMQMAELQLWGTINANTTRINNKEWGFSVEVSPNPINDRATIALKLENTHDVSVVIYDAFGRPIEEFQKKRKDAGYHSIRWNASNVSPGIYYCRISVNGNAVTKKLIINR